MDQALTAYGQLMNDIKARLAEIRRIIAGHSPLGHEGMDTEVAGLLIRRVLEQIAFSSLVAHRELYEANFADRSKTWRAKALLDRLETLHPTFYPQPLDLTGYDRYGAVYANTKGTFLTKEEFIFLYDKTSEIIHARNPFKEPIQFIDLRYSVADWLARIVKLLNLHMIELAGTEDILVVQMVGDHDGEIQVSLAGPPPDYSGLEFSMKA